MLLGHEEQFFSRFMCIMKHFYYTQSYFRMSDSNEAAKETLYSKKRRRVGGGVLGQRVLP